ARHVLPLLMAVLLAACGTPTPVSPIAALPTNAPKLLATVFMSPTPGEAEQRATAFAERPTTTLVPTQTTSPTPYIGVFLGEVDALDDGGVPLVNSGLFDENVGSQLDIPTPVRPVCTIEPELIFGTLWRDNDTARIALGCPTEPIQMFEGAIQVFENGVMYFRPTGDIWAIAPAGAQAGQFWYAATAPEAPAEEQAIIAPDGLRVPTLGFGAVWSAIAGVRDTLGFARTDESAVTAYWQRFEGGSLFRDDTSGQVFILVGIGTSGEAYGPY
ncbi:MAG: hypothetical protein H7175_23110, partial [Burkholderiales bacterium]|nr:hypothetical protein [Anaerolineae bacterium]